MSAEAMGWVFRYSPFDGVTFTCHLAIADSVNDQHEYQFFMAMGNLAKKARTSRRGAQRALRELENAGFVELLKKDKGEVRWYRFLFPQAVEVFQGGRRSDAPPATRATWRGRHGDAQTQVVTQMNARGASHEEHFSPGSGVIKRFPRSNPNNEEAS